MTHLKIRTKLFSGCRYRSTEENYVGRMAMKKKRYPTVFIVAFCASCVVLAILAGSIANHDVALSAIAVVG